jgi:hypothetical protein
MIEMIAKILASLISTLGVATKQIKQGRLSESILTDKLTTGRLKGEQRNSGKNFSGIMKSRQCSKGWNG